MPAAWFNITLSIVLLLVLIAIGYVVLNPIYVLKPVLYTCKTVLPAVYEKKRDRSITIYRVNPTKPRRLIFVPGGGFLRCCIDFTPFMTTSLRGYELFYLEYEPLTENLDIESTVADLASVYRAILADEPDKLTTFVGYSAGTYLTLKALETVDFPVDKYYDFVGIHGWYGVSPSVMLQFYNWLYLPSFLRVNKHLDVHLITGDMDPLQTSTYEFFNRYRIGQPAHVIPQGDHYTFYDSTKNAEYLRIITDIVEKRAATLANFPA